MNRTLFVAALLIPLLAACATQESGIRDPERFRAIAERTMLTSARPHTEVAACFRDTATLLPMTSFIEQSETQTSYRLRGYGFTFEEIDFAATQAGSEISVLLAPGVNDKWRRDFERDRMAPLRTCADASVSR